MAFDFDPRNSSLFTGAGTPWSGFDNPAPTPFDMNPDNYKGYNSSKLRQALSQRIAQRGGEAQAQAQAALRKAGIKGADTSRALTDLSAQQEMGMNEMDANLDFQDYQSKLQLMDMARRQYEMERGFDTAADQSREAGRSALWQNLFNTGSQVGGTLLGSWADKKFGGKTPGTPDTQPDPAGSSIFDPKKGSKKNPYNVSLW